MLAAPTPALAANSSNLAGLNVKAGWGESVNTSGPASTKTTTGTLSDGTTYLFEVPSNWNGTLFLYSHGVQFSPTPIAQDTLDGVTGGWLLSQGFALAGGSYPVTDYQPMLQYP